MWLCIRVITAARSPQRSAGMAVSPRLRTLFMLCDRVSSHSYAVETPREYTHRISAHSSDPVPPGARQPGSKLLGSCAEHLELRPISRIRYGTRCRYG